MRFASEFFMRVLMKYNAVVFALYIRSEHNRIADKLSRGDIDEAGELMPRRDHMTRVDTSHCMAQWLSELVIVAKRAGQRKRASQAQLQRWQRKMRSTYNPPRLNGLQSANVHKRARR